MGARPEKPGFRLSSTTLLGTALLPVFLSGQSSDERGPHSTPRRENWDLF